MRTTMSMLLLLTLVVAEEVKMLDEHRVAGRRGGAIRMVTRGRFRVLANRAGNDETETQSDEVGASMNGEWDLANTGGSAPVNTNTGGSAPVVTFTNTGGSAPVNTSTGGSAPVSNTNGGGSTPISANANTGDSTRVISTEDTMAAILSPSKKANKKQKSMNQAEQFTDSRAARSTATHAKSVAAKLPSCSPFGKCQPTSFFGFSDNWKQHRVCRHDVQGDLVTCESKDCPAQAAGLSSGFVVDVQRGCVKDTARTASVPTPFCAYTHNQRFGSVSAGAMHTCAAASTGRATVCFGNDASRAAKRGLKAVLQSLGGAKLVQVSAGWKHSCGLTLNHTLGCWGYDAGGSRVSAVPGGKVVARGGRPGQYNNDWVSYILPGQWLQVSVGRRGTCGVKLDHTLSCWGQKHWYGPFGMVPGQWLQVSVGERHKCGLKLDRTLACWGGENFKYLSGLPGSKVTTRSSRRRRSRWRRRRRTAESITSIAIPGQWLQVTVGNGHSCGVKLDHTLACWGDDSSKQLSGFPGGKATDNSYTLPGQWLQVSAGAKHSCGLKMDLTLACWGDDGCKQLSGFPGGKGTANSYTLPGQWLQVSAGGYVNYGNTANINQHSCGVTTKMELECWGDNTNDQSTIPNGFFFTCHKSCSECTSSLPTGCTKCPVSLPHHTVVDPVKMAGTCTKKFCPLCQPKQCCGPNHKHFVFSAESMQGVCVRHTDQCQPLCIPMYPNSIKWPNIRVCSKGCNQLVRIPNERFAVCQAQKQVRCERATQDSVEQCSVDKEVVTKATCQYSSKLWQIGGTCIVDVLSNPRKMGVKYACPPKVTKRTIQRIRRHCMEVKQDETSSSCSPIGLAF